MVGVVSWRGFLCAGVSPYLVAPAELHAGDSVFVVLALDRHGAAATALLSLPGTAEITPTPPDMTGKYAGLPHSRHPTPYLPPLPLLQAL